MSQHESLIRRLCEASEGSAELSAEVWTALTGEEYEARQHFTAGFMYVAKSDVPAENLLLDDMVPCLTTDLSAAWEEAERRGFYPLIDTLARGDGREYEVSLFVPDPSDFLPKGVAYARTPALGITAALLAAEGER